MFSLIDEQSPEVEAGLQRGDFKWVDYDSFKDLADSKIDEQAKAVCSLWFNPEGKIGPSESSTGVSKMSLT